MSFACTQTLISARFLSVVWSPYYASPTFPNHTTIFIYMRLAEINLVRTQSVELKNQMRGKSNGHKWVAKRPGCCWQPKIGDSWMMWSQTTTHENGTQSIHQKQIHVVMHKRRHANRQKGVKVPYDICTWKSSIRTTQYGHRKVIAVPPSQICRYMRKSRAMPMKSMD